MKKIKLGDYYYFAELGLYTVYDVFGKKMPGLAIQAFNPEGELMTTLTVSFGEFIGVKNVAYMDTNNNSNIEDLLTQGAKDTGFTKKSGFCTYPLYLFEEKFLREVNNEIYQKYSDAFDNYYEALREESEYAG